MTAGTRMNKGAFDAALSAARVPSVVAMVTSPDEVIYEGAVGVDMETPHAIMSMTKPITSMAIMMMIESGKLTLATPLTDVLPDYREQEVLSNVDLANRTFDTTPITNPITIRHLLNHTAGFGYAFCNHELHGLLPESNSPGFPLLHQPGERWTYGVSTGVLGEVLCEVAGKDLATTLDDLIFKPLGMKETSYEVQDNQVQPHRRSGGVWEQSKSYPKMQVGDAGLISTAQDYGRFVRCLLNRGAPLVSDSTFDEMTSNQIGELTVETMPAADPSITCPFPTGGGTDKFGLGFQIHESSATGRRSAGSLSWCGLLNTYFWCDPVKALGAVVLMQALPLYDPACLAVVDEIELAIYE